MNQNTHKRDLLGVPLMLHGLNYHFGNYMNWAHRIIHCEQDNKETSILFSNLKHEFFAYCCCFRSFWYFARRKEKEGFLKEWETEEFKILREITNKVAAHRAVDKPRGETIGEQYSWDLVFSGYNTRLCDDGFPIHGRVADNQVDMRQFHPKVYAQVELIFKQLA